MDNVINFPKRYSEDGKFVPNNIEEIDNRIEMVKHHHIQETLSTVVPMLFANLEAAGFDFSDDSEESVMDGAFLVESIRALLCKHHGLEHPFQEVAQNIFTQDSDHEGMLKVVESLNIKFKDVEKGTS